RKPKKQKHVITVRVNDTPITVVLHPPTTARSSWYAYWNGLVTSKSTGKQTLEEAIEAVEHMVKNQGGSRPTLQDANLTDEEFESIQRAYFGRKHDPAAKKRADKTLDDCLEAVEAFKSISGVKPIAAATADDC